MQRQLRRHQPHRAHSADGGSFSLTVRNQTTIVRETQVVKQFNLAEFLAMPPGTVFSFWRPAIANGLHVKGETIQHDDADSLPYDADFYYLPLLPEAANTSGPLDLTPVMSNSLYRWGMYDEDQLFAVYEKDDLAILVRRFGRDPQNDDC